MPQGKFNRVVFSSKSYKHNTPDDLIKELDQEFSFNFDPCPPVRFGNFSGNGLQSDWIASIEKGKRRRPNFKTRVFCNPPYKRSVTYRWIVKAYTQLQLGNCEIVVFLLPFRNSDFFKLLRKMGAEFRLCEKRLKFQKEDKVQEGAPFDSVIAVVKR